jgi:hypothetical protein
VTIVIDNPSMTREEAERISSRIGLRLDTMADTWAGALPLIREAIERNAYSALGYASHGAYVSDRFGDSLSKLGVELRREIVRELTEAGLSTRAIAPVVGVSDYTVRQDQRAGARDLAPERVSTMESPALSSSDPEFNPTPTLPPRDDDWSPMDVPGLDPITGEVHEAGDEETEPPAVRTVTGLDGKQYKQPAAKEPRRPSLVDEAFRANTELWKAIERIRSIRADDRYTRNKVDILAALQPSADLATEILADLFTPEGAM